MPTRPAPRCRRSAARASARRGTRWLIREQTAAGGWRIAGSGAVNAQSTAWALQGLVAAGRNPDRVRSAGRSGIDYLLNRQDDDGHIAYSNSTDQTPVWVTAQAIVPLFGQGYPVEPVDAPRPQENDSGRRRWRRRHGGGSADSGGVAPADTGGAVGRGSSPSSGGRGSAAAGQPGADVQRSSGGDTPTSSGDIGDAAAAPSGGGAGVPEAEERPGEAAEDDATSTPPRSRRGELTAAEADEAEEDEPLAPLGVGLGTAMAVAFGVWWLHATAATAEA